MKKVIIFYLLFDLIIAGGVLFLLEPPKKELTFGAIWFGLAYTVFGLGFFLALTSLFKALRGGLNKLVTFVLLFVILNATVLFLDGTVLSRDFLVEITKTKWTEGAWIKLFVHLDFLLSYALISIDFKRVIS